MSEEQTVVTAAEMLAKMAAIRTAKKPCRFQHRFHAGKAQDKQDSELALIARKKKRAMQRASRKANR